MDGERHGPAFTVLAYGLVLVLAVELAVWGAFLVPLRAFGVPLPVGPLIALVGNGSLGYAGMRVLRSRIGAAGPFLIWLPIALIAGTSRHGDLVLPASVMSYAFLLAGTVGSLAVIGLNPSPAPGVGR